MCVVDLVQGMQGECTTVGKSCSRRLLKGNGLLDSTQAHPASVSLILMAVPVVVQTRL